MKLQLIAVLFIIGCLSCGKEFLDVKRDQSLVIPEQIEHLQALLDDASRTMNVNSSHEMGVVGADELELDFSVWENIPNRPYEKNGYIWADDVYEGNPVKDWDNAYRRILFANTALEGIAQIVPSAGELAAWNNVKGSALFFRAFNFYQLAQLFCKPFDAGTANTDPGIPLRLEPDITAKVGRSTVMQTYQQIIADLLSSVQYLPNRAEVAYRPSKAASYALLAKAFLLMGDYPGAAEFADSCLAIQDALIDLNDVSHTATFTFPQHGLNNPEVIFNCSMTSIAIVTSSRMNIARSILDLYDEHDLRKPAFFREGTNGRTIFKGSYMGSGVLFTGLAVDEVLLVRAECYAREGMPEMALADLNRLLEKRHRAADFVPLADIDQTTLLDLIIEERIRELVLRGTRWEDLRRLNKETRYQKTIIRELGANVFKLEPNDMKRYVWPIPDNALQLGGYVQNPR